MKTIFAMAVALCVLPALACAEPAKHFPSGGSRVSGPTPAYSAAVDMDGTLYISGTADGTDPDTGKLPVDAATGAKVVMNSIKRIVENAGYSMDDIVWLQIATSDLSYYADFNRVYRTYFKGPLPARAFIGGAKLLGDAHFEIFGIAKKGAAAK
jgi:2-iminobutanoate/2-iminopropanoate deaminase